MSREARLAAGIVALVAVSAGLQAAGLETALRYDRVAVRGGELWRLLSANLVHLDTAHLALNAAGLALVALLVGRWLSLRAWGAVLLICALAVGLGLWWFAPDVGWYVGLSGVLHGLFATGAACAAWRGPERGFHALLLAVLALKLAWEQLAGALPGTAWLAGGSVIVDAHLFGAVGGLTACALLLGRQRLRR